MGLDQYYFSAICLVEAFYFSSSYTIIRNNDRAMSMYSLICVHYDVSDVLQRNHLLLWFITGQYNVILNGPGILL